MYKSYLSAAPRHFKIGQCWAIEMERMKQALGCLEIPTLNQLHYFNSNLDFGPNERACSLEQCLVPSLVFFQNSTKHP